MAQTNLSFSKFQNYKNFGEGEGRDLLERGGGGRGSRGGGEGVQRGRGRGTTPLAVQTLRHRPGGGGGVQSEACAPSGLPMRVRGRFGGPFALRTAVTVTDDRLKMA